MAERLVIPPKDHKCRQHKRENLVMVCKGCNYQFVCLACIGTTHQGHICIRKEDYIRMRRERLEALASDTNTKRSAIEICLGTASECKVKNRADKEAIIKKIRQKGEDMKKSIDEWVEDNVYECDGLYKENEEKIDGVNKLYNEHMDKLSSTLAHCKSTVTAFSYEFEALEKQLKSQVSKSTAEIPDLEQVELMPGENEKCRCDMYMLLGKLKIMRECEMDEFKWLRQSVTDTENLSVDAKLGRYTWKGTFRKGPAVIKAFNPRRREINRESFMEAATILQSLTHFNVVRLYDLCTSSDPIYTVVEYMADGDLQSYLQQADYDVTGDLLIDFAAQIADGMTYVSSKGIIHRHIMAKNILVDTTTVKVANFTMAVKLDSEADTCKIYRGETKNFAIKWTALEALQNGIFTLKSDVWSFGVLLWEIMSNGLAPYPDMDNLEVIEKVENGYRMSSPDYCPKPIYDTMMKCWSAEYEKRPTFDVLRELLYNFNRLNMGGQQFNSLPQSYPPKQRRRRRKGLFKIF